MEWLASEFAARVERVPGARHAFLKQVLRRDQQPVREAVGRELAALPDGGAERIRGGLCSFDNRRFFQAFSEILALAALRRAGWEIAGYREEWILRRPDGQETILLVAAFLHAGRPALELAERRRLARALARVRARRRFACFLRRPLPVGHDPEPIRRAVERWLREVEQGGWKGRYAAYDDGAISLEFSLVDQRVPPGASPVALVVGPFLGGPALDAVERRVVAVLDRFRLGPLGDRPALLAVVGDRPWPAGEAGWHTLLYGRFARACSQGGGPAHAEFVVGRDPEPSLFKDPLYRGLVGMVRWGRLDAMVLEGCAWANPFAGRPLRASEVPTALLGCDGEDQEGYRMRWMAWGRPALDLQQEG